MNKTHEITRLLCPSPKVNKLYVGVQKFMSDPWRQVSNQLLIKKVLLNNAHILLFMEVYSDIKVLLELIVLCIGVADCLEVGRDCYFWKQRYWSANELFFLPYNIK